MSDDTTQQGRLVSVDEVRAAAAVLGAAAAGVVRTPLLICQDAPEFGLKPENLQPVGAFKIRGATYALSRLPADRRAAGVVTHSSGNHGQALAYAGRVEGIAVTVVMPESAPAVKVEATRRQGAEIVLVPPADRVPATLRLIEERGLTLIPPFDHPDIIAGQGTIGIEILEDLPDVDVVVVPIGGGGLASGVATAITALAPGVAVIGVEPEHAADAAESLRTGTRCVWPVERTHRTIADGVRIGLSDLTFAHLRARVDAVVTVTDEEILGTVGALARSTRIVVEPSGAVAPAAVLHRRRELPPGRTVAVVSGGNIDPALLATTLR
jgi:threonine dehydratase